MIETLLTLIAPHECMICGAEGMLLCEDCASHIPAPPSCCYRCKRVTSDYKTCKACQNTSALRRVTPRAAYESTAKDLVWKLKFGRAKAAAATIARLVPTELFEKDDSALLVHVPTASSRIRQRGYDQTRLIARQLSRLHGLPYAPILMRVGQHRQVGASGAMRRQQLQHAFRVTLPGLITGKRIILIDDVVTSGATLETAASVLKQAGARHIDAVVFARA